MMLHLKARQSCTDFISLLSLLKAQVTAVFPPARLYISNNHRTPNYGSQSRMVPSAELTTPCTNQIERT